MNKHHHHYYGPQIPGIDGYQRVYNKFTPTPIVQSSTSNSSNHSSIVGVPMKTPSMNMTTLGKPWSSAGVLFNGTTSN
jgi:hypothetical protein